MALGPEIDISVSKLLSFETVAKSLRVSVSVSENLVSEKKVSVSVSKKIGLGKKSQSRFQKIWSRKRKNPNNKNSARNDVPNLGLGPNWDQSPEMVPYKSQFCSQVPNFILVARCQAKSSISLINSTVNNNKKMIYLI